MKTRQELLTIATGAQILRNTNSLTEVVIRATDKFLNQQVNSYGNLSVECNIGKSSLNKFIQIEDIRDSKHLDEIAIRRYFTNLGIFITFKNIGSIEDKSIIVSLVQEGIE